MNGALTGVAAGLEGLRFGLLPAAERQAALRERDRIGRDITGLAARMTTPDAPLLVVIGGVTGGGKSTLVNTLVGRVVATTGVRRPTTSQPTLACHSDSRGWFEGERILPSLERRQGHTPSGDGGPSDVLWLVSEDRLPVGVAVLDAPDSDSVSRDNRELARMLLDAADVWVWVTTQGKYADEASMELLRRARDRGAAAVTVLNHLDPDTMTRVADDFANRLATEGLQDVRTFTIPRAEVVDQRLPEFAVFDLRAWLWSLAEPGRRDALRGQTISGAVAALPAAISDLLEKVAEERRTAQALINAATMAFDQAADRFSDMLDDGKISLRDQVLSSWVSFLGTGWFQRLVQETPGHVKGAVKKALRPLGRTREERLEQELKVEATDAVGDAVGRLVDVAAGNVARAWLADPVGRDLLADDDTLHGAGPDLAPGITAAIAAWERDLRGLLEEVGAGRRRRAQWASGLGNAVVLSLMVATFASTGGLTGAEVAIAGAGAPVVQLLLEKVLGDQNVRWLVARAKASLLEHVREVLAAERRRYVRAVADRAPEEDDVDQVQQAVTELGRLTS